DECSVPWYNGRVLAVTARPAYSAIMKVPEHLALSFLMAQFGVQQQYGPGGTALVMLAGFLPDLDAVTAVAGWDVYRRWPRKLGHGLPMTLLGPVSLALLGAFVFHLGPFLPLW